MPDNSDVRYEMDPQSGVVYKLVPEGNLAISCAIFSGVYLLFSLAFFVWLMFDVWFGTFRLATLLKYSSISGRVTPTFLTFAYAFIGGGLGATVNEFRSFTVWHAERGSFGPRFIWKSVFAPWIGAILALFAMALLQSGVGILGADFKGTEASTRQALSMFALGALAGFGSREVCHWIDLQVKRVFSTDAVATMMPTLIGKPRAEAEAILKAANLTLGKINELPQEDKTQIGKVVLQSTPAGSPIVGGVAVEITVGTTK